MTTPLPDDPTPAPPGSAGSRGRWLLIAAAAALIAAVAGLWIWRSSSGPEEPQDAAAAARAFLDSIGCREPQFSRLEGDRAATWADCADGSEVAFFDGEIQQQNYVMGVGSSGRPIEGYVIVGPGWSVVTDDTDMAQAALDQGGQRLL